MSFPPWGAQIWPHQYQVRNVYLPSSFSQSYFQCSPGGCWPFLLNKGTLLVYGQHLVYEVLKAFSLPSYSPATWQVLVYGVLPMCRTSHFSLLNIMKSLSVQLPKSFWRVANTFDLLVPSPVFISSVNLLRVHSVPIIQVIKEYVKRNWLRINAWGATDLPPAGLSAIDHNPVDSANVQSPLLCTYLTHTCQLVCEDVGQLPKPY